MFFFKFVKLIIKTTLPVIKPDLGKILENTSSAIDFLT